VEAELIKIIRLRQSEYLAFEVIKSICPSAASRFHARFQGLLAYYHGRDREVVKGVRSPSPDYSGPRIILEDGRPSGRFIPAIVDALFHDFLRLHEADDPWQMKTLFCERELPRFLRQYFPESALRPTDMKRLRQICQNLNVEAAEAAAAYRRADFEEIKEADRFVLESRNAAWHELIRTAVAAARSRAPILLTGESGTGKEVLARFIHRRSPSGQGPFVPVNCGAIPENLLESELFGYRRGAFSEARQDKPGQIVLAEGGTLFLDEIAEMSPFLQVKLLRFLQDHKVLPLGGVRAVKVNVRILAATNRDPETARAEGTFRQDLFYRLNVFRLNLPPLRDRIEDIPDLTDWFITLSNRENNAQVKGLTKEAAGLLLRYSWPGNIRELENVIHRGVILADRGLIGPDHLPPEVTRFSPASRPGLPDEPSCNREVLLQALAQALALPPGPTGRPRRLAESVSLIHLVRFFESLGRRSFAPRELTEFISPPYQPLRRDKLAHLILKALQKAGILDHNGRKAQAARYCLTSGLKGKNPR